MTKFTIEMRDDGSISFEIDRIGTVTLNTETGKMLKADHDGKMSAAMKAVLEA